MQNLCTAKNSVLTYSIVTPQVSEALLLEGDEETMDDSELTEVNEQV